MLGTSCANMSKFSIDSIELGVPEMWNTKIPYNDAFTGVWWEQFEDKNLEKFIEEFQKNSPDLKSLTKNRNIAYQTSKINGAGIFPSFNAK